MANNITNFQHYMSCTSSWITHKWLVLFGIR